MLTTQDNKLVDILQSATKCGAVPAAKQECDRGYARLIQTTNVGIVMPSGTCVPVEFVKAADSTGKPIFQIVAFIGEDERVAELYDFFTATIQAGDRSYGILRRFNQMSQLEDFDNGAITLNRSDFGAIEAKYKQLNLPSPYAQ